MSGIVRVEGGGAWWSLARERAVERAARQEAGVRVCAVRGAAQCGAVPPLAGRRRGRVLAARRRRVVRVRRADVRQQLLPVARHVRASASLVRLHAGVGLLHREA